MAPPFARFSPDVRSIGSGSGDKKCAARREVADIAVSVASANRPKGRGVIMDVSASI